MSILPEVKVYLPDDLYSKVARESNRSSIVQRALRMYYSFDEESWKSRVVTKVRDRHLSDLESVLSVAASEFKGED